jgi:hypothetical protein
MYHLVPTITPTYFAFGTIFHECLHQLYGHKSLDEIYGFIEANMTDESEKKMMLNMIDGYYSVVLEDLDTYVILEIEQSWEFLLVDGVTLCGSIDMIVLNLTDSCIYGFEHKSTARFKEPIMVKLDEQMRVYSIALHEIIKAFNKKHNTNYGYGGIVLNEVRKLQKTFDYKRTVCKYSEADLTTFLEGIVRVVKLISCDSIEKVVPDPEPSPMKCTQCQFATICESFGYKEVQLNEILNTLSEKFTVREIDHLDAKKEKYGTNED